MCDHEDTWKHWGEKTLLGMRPLVHGLAWHVLARLLVHITREPPSQSKSRDKKIVSLEFWWVAHRGTEDLNKKTMYSGHSASPVIEEATVHFLPLSYSNSTKFSRFGVIARYARRKRGDTGVVEKKKNPWVGFFPGRKNLLRFWLHTFFLGGKTCCAFDCTSNVDTAIEDKKRIGKKLQV